MKIYITGIMGMLRQEASCIISYSCYAFLRSETASNDFATTADVILEVLREYENLGRTFEYAACIYPTTPFVTCEKLKRGMQLFREKDTTLVMPVILFSHPPQRCYVLSGECFEMERKSKYPFSGFRTIFS